MIRFQGSKQPYAGTLAEMRQLKTDHGDSSKEFRLYPGDEFYVGADPVDPATEGIADSAYYWDGSNWIIYMNFDAALPS